MAEFSVYLGAYLKIKKIKSSFNLYDLVGDAFSDFRREVEKTKVIYVTPNEHRYSLNRKSYFNLHDSKEVFPISETEIPIEIELFSEHYKEEIELISEHAECEILWGIIPTYD